MSLGFKSQSVGVRANLCDDRTVNIWSMYSRTLLDILFLIWGQTVADYKILSFHLSINVIIIVVSFKILDLCPIALFQQLWNTLYVIYAVCIILILWPCHEYRNIFCSTAHICSMQQTVWQNVQPNTVAFLCLPVMDFTNMKLVPCSHVYLITTV